MRVGQASEVLSGCSLPHPPFACGPIWREGKNLPLQTVFSDRWHTIWRGDWFVPLPGIVFLPFTTIENVVHASPLAQ